MNSIWFKEERALPKEQRAKAMSEAKDILGHSVFVTDKLKRILEDEIHTYHLKDEEYELDGWETRALANAGARRALRKLLNILP